jgi:hypothetical protein
MDLNLDSPTVITITDEPLSNGRCHTLSLTVWTMGESPVDERREAARSLAIGFLERTLSELRRAELA